MRLSSPIEVYSSRSLTRRRQQQQGWIRQITAELQCVQQLFETPRGNGNWGNEEYTEMKILLSTRGYCGRYLAVIDSKMQLRGEWK